MTFKQRKERIYSFIKEDNLERAISEMSTLLRESPVLEEIVFQAGRFSELNRQIRLGVIDYKNADITKNKIRAAILHLLNKIEININKNRKSENETTLHKNIKELIKNRNNTLFWDEKAQQLNEKIYPIITKIIFLNLFWISYVYITKGTSPIRLINDILLILSLFFLRERFGIGKQKFTGSSKDRDKWIASEWKRFSNSKTIFVILAILYFVTYAISNYDYFLNVKYFYFFIITSLLFFLVYQYQRAKVQIEPNLLLNRDYCDFAEVMFNSFITFGVCSLISFFPFSNEIDIYLLIIAVFFILFVYLFIKTNTALPINSFQAGALRACLEI